MKRSTMGTGIAGIAAATLLVAGCGSDDGAGAASSSEAGADGSKAQSLVLAKGEFPAGYESLDFDKDAAFELAKTADSVSTGKVTPASCAKGGVLPDDVKADQVGVAAAMKGTEGTLVESVTALDRPIKDYRAAVTGKCAKVTTTLASGPMAGLKATVKSTVLDPPDTAAGDQILVYRQDSTTKASGQTSRTQSLTGIASVDGYVVRMQFSPLTPGAKADRAAFDKAFAAAVDKIAEKA
ncbi:hypothetical protein [Gordonia humi]|uniref:Major membrane immunogen (Membrane-anchored lipoprotein) n=1 Tax=Gordonia humi TaxID=686429 RepID=A0A840EQW9_9ACTN|nr:hypothetical protein [Gordonia humi]MBB4133921.1 major membrane immunogen (membrane-anchored lipoprotein) [Gordonia humi]